MAEETVRLAEDTAQVELEAQALVWLALIAAWQGSDDVSLSYIERAHMLTAVQPIRLVDDAARWVLGALEASGSAMRHPRSRSSSRSSIRSSPFSRRSTA